MKFHRKKRSSREFVKQKKRKQNPEAQIEKKRSEQTTTSTNKKENRSFIYEKTNRSIPQTILLSYIHTHAIFVFVLVNL
jgi:hypothetical protein